MSTTEPKKDRRAEHALMSEHKGSPGLSYRADPKRQCVHIAIHDGAMAGASITFDADQFHSLVVKFLGVEIDSIKYLRDAVNHARAEVPDLIEALQAVQVLLTPKATHCHRIIADALAKAKGAR